MYDKYVNFKPTKQILTLSHDCEVNLINIESRNVVYKTSPELFAKEQVNNFIEQPSRLKIGFKRTQIINNEMIHPRLTNDALSKYSSLNLGNKIQCDSSMGLVVMMGCGLGIQIKELIKNHKVNNLFLYDNEHDSFYASLFVTDWKEIVEIFESRKGKIRINVGEPVEKALYRMRSLPHDIGLYNMTTTYLFMHTNSNDNQVFMDKLIKETSLITSYQGFFDDEQISFSHSIEHINNNIPTFFPKKINNEHLPPAFVIGNGPSLDNMVDLIRSYQNKVIIISCGTALSSLESLGIKPDFHVEMERNYSIAQVLKSSTSLEYTKSITLLSLNTVSPYVTCLFKDSYIALKPNDLGTAIYQDLMHHNKTFNLPLCNPTVSNCGASYAINMGFKEIYLLGMDFGMKDDKQHHSKHSFWSRLEANNKDKHAGIADYSFSDGRYKTTGNFGGEVTTQTILDASRKNIELLLKENPEVTCYNPNDGAKINYAKTIKVENIKLKNKQFDKIKTIKNLINNNFIKNNLNKITKETINKKYLSILSKTRNGIILPKKCNDINSLHRELSRIFNNINAIERAHNVTALLIKGSVQIHSSLITYYCSRAENKKQFEECYKIGMNIYNKLIDEIIKFMESTPLKLDNTKVLK